MWSLACSQAVDQPICCFGSELRAGLAGPAALVLNPKASRSATLGCAWDSQPLLPVCTHPRFQVWAPCRGLRLGGQLGFQLWAPSPLIWVRATGIQVSAGAAYPVFTVQGLRGEGAPEASAAAKSSLNSC